MKFLSRNWNLKEIQIIYYLTFWGYSAKEIGEIAPSLITTRSSDGIRGMCTDIRKYLSKKKGYIVSNYDLSEKAESNITKASKLPIAEDLAIYGLEKKEFKPCHRTKERSLKQQPVITDVSPSTEIHTLVVKERAAEPIKTIDTGISEPNVLDVMRLAKELGASEVEYKGVKIKY